MLSLGRDVHRHGRPLCRRVGPSIVWLLLSCKRVHGRTPLMAIATVVTLYWPPIFQVDRLYANLWGCITFKACATMTLQFNRTFARTIECGTGDRAGLAKCGI